MTPPESIPEGLANTRLAEPVPTATKTPRSDYALLAGLYISQFLGIGFFYTGVVGILREGGASLDQLGLIQLLGIIWGIKFLWAPLVDRFGSRRLGHFRSWLLVLQSAIAVGLLVLAAFDPVADFAGMMVIAGLVVLLSATQDIASDALAVRILDEGARGVGNGIQVAAGYVGNILGGGAVLILYDAFGWAAALITLAVVTAIPMWMIIRYREPASLTDITRPRFRDFVRLFRAPGVARWAFGLLPLLWIGISAAYALITPMLVDAGWSLTAIGILSTMVGGAGAIASALGTGFLIRRFGRIPVLVVGGIVQVVAILALLPLAAGGIASWVVVIIVIMMNMSYGAVSTVIYTVHMDLSRPTTPGTDYTLLASFAFIASLVAGAVGLSVAELIGYGWVLGGSALLVAIGLLLAPRVVAGQLHRSTGQVGIDPVVALGRPAPNELDDEPAIGESDR